MLNKWCSLENTFVLMFLILIKFRFEWYKIAWWKWSGKKIQILVKVRRISCDREREWTDRHQNAHFCSNETCLNEQKTLPGSYPRVGSGWGLGLVWFLCARKFRLYSKSNFERKNHIRFNEKFSGCLNSKLTTALV